MSALTVTVRPLDYRCNGVRPSWAFRPWTAARLREAMLGHRDESTRALFEAQRIEMGPVFLGSRREERAQAKRADAMRHLNAAKALGNRGVVVGR